MKRRSSCRSLWRRRCVYNVHEEKLHLAGIEGHEIPTLGGVTRHSKVS